MNANDAIVEEWFARTLESYPQVTARFLALEKDPFRNPVGHTFQVICFCGACATRSFGTFRCSRIILPFFCCSASRSPAS